MRVFVYELLTAGGWQSYGAGPTAHSLLAEGAAMLRAIAADLAAIEGVSVDIMLGSPATDFSALGCTVHFVRSAADEPATFARLAAAADWSIVIAPELDGLLHARCRLVEQSGGRLLGPTSSLVALCADKHATAEHLSLHGIRVPQGIALEPRQRLPLDFEYPAVLKPRDGAGSMDIRTIASAGEVAVNGARPARLERFCPGTAASVAVLCGPGLIAPLPPCWQWLSDDGHLAYHGGSLPLPSNLARRASRLARAAVESLPEPRGYLGVDLVLGHDDQGRDDVVIEINPRLTTSYVGQRALASCNLAQAMLGVALGRWVELSWRAGSVQFEASGQVRHIPAIGQSTAGAV